MAVGWHCGAWWQPALLTGNPGNRQPVKKSPLVDTARVLSGGPTGIVACRHSGSWHWPRHWPYLAEVNFPPLCGTDKAPICRQDTCCCRLDPQDFIDYQRAFDTSWAEPIGTPPDGSHVTAPWGTDIPWADLTGTRAQDPHCSPWLIPWDNCRHQWHHMISSELTAHSVTLSKIKITWNNLWPLVAQWPWLVWDSERTSHLRLSPGYCLQNRHNGKTAWRITNHENS